MLATFLLLTCWILSAIAIGMPVLLRIARLSRAEVVEPDGRVPPRVSIIVPARNEEGDVEAALRSLLAQVGVDHEIILVDDHSDDRTGEIAARLAREDPRLRVVTGPPLREGWFGKVNAMQSGTALASADVLLFSDADVIHGPRSVLTGLRTIESEELDLVSFMPAMRCESLWENVLLPVYAARVLQFCGRKIDELGSNAAIAAGAYMMIRREVFEKVGGFAPLRNAMLDDVGLARLVKESGGRAVTRHIGDELRVRLFKGNRDAFWGLTKNVLALVGGRYWLALPLSVFPFFVFGVPIAALARGVTHGDVVLAASGAIAYTLQYLGFLPVCSFIRLRFVKALLFPLAAFSNAACMLRALYYRWVKGSVYWRGRLVKDHDGADRIPIVARAAGSRARGG